MSLREQLMSAASKGAKPFNVPGSDLTVYLKRLTFRDRRKISGFKNEDEREAFLIENAVLDAEGKPIFTEGDGLHLVTEKDGFLVGPILEAVMSYNRVDQAKVDEAKND